MKMTSFLLLIVFCMISVSGAQQAPARPPVNPAINPGVAPPSPDSKPTLQVQNGTAKNPTIPLLAPNNPGVTKFAATPTAVFWALFAAMTLILCVGLLAFVRTLTRDKDWSLADAMSGPDGKPSSSRLIAFLGFLVMVVVILGIGYSSIWAFLQTGQLPTLSGASTFLLACAGLFAPYFANQIGLAVGGPSPAQTTLAPVVVQSGIPTVQPGQVGPLSVTFGPPVPPGTR